MVFGKKKIWHCLPGQEPTELDKKVMYWENKGKEGSSVKRLDKDTGTNRRYPTKRSYKYRCSG